MRKGILFLCLSLCAPMFLQASPNPQLLLDQAKQEGKYSYIFLYKDGDAQSKKLEVLFDQSTKSVGGGNFFKVEAQDQQNKAFLQNMSLNSTPLPFVLVVAPNGAITGGFTESFTETDLLNAQVSAAAEEALKGIQEQKLVFLVIQNEETTKNQEALMGVQDFIKDARFSPSSIMVKLNPTNKKEEKFLQQLNVDPSVKEARTLLLSAPGDVIGRFSGATNKEQFIQIIQKSTSECCPGGCCSGKSCS
jgi:hypothetical protein